MPMQTMAGGAVAVSKGASSVVDEAIFATLPEVSCCCSGERSTEGERMEG